MDSKYMVFVKVFCISIFLSNGAKAGLIEINFTIPWSAPYGSSLFGVSTRQVLNFSAFVDTNSVSAVVPAGSIVGGQITYKYDIFLFDKSAVNLTEVTYGTKIWDRENLSPIGFGSNGVSLLGALAIEGGLNSIDFKSAAIRLVDNDGRLDFATALRQDGSRVSIGQHIGTIINTPITSMSVVSGEPQVYLREISTSGVPSIPEPTVLALMSLGLIGLGFSQRQYFTLLRL